MITTPNDPGPIRSLVRPVKIAWFKDVDASMLLEPHSGQARVVAPKSIRFSHPSVIVLDFGREIYGGVRVVVGHTAESRPARLRVRFGESFSEAMGDPNQDHAIHDQVIAVARLGATEIGNTGFRFVRIEPFDPTAVMDLQAVLAVSLLRDVKELGTFQCSDDRLNKIWQTGVRTVHLCMQDYLWDGIKRDRLVWVGDLHPEARVVAAVFGDHPIVRGSLDFARDEFPLPKWMNGISSYSLWWVIIQRDWFQHFGRLDYLKEQRSYLLGLLKLLADCVTTDGREQLPDMRFLDWPSTRDPAAVHAGLQALLSMALVAGSELCDFLEEPKAAREAAGAAAKLHRHVTAAPGSKQANALLALAGLYDPLLANQRELAVDPLAGVSTFYGYYVLQARAKAGDYAGCVDLIKQYWGGMLDRGATSFWEDFNLTWLESSGRIDEPTPPGLRDLHADFGDFCYIGLRHSLCHGWAAGPVAWISEHILGVTPLSPGFTRARVAPKKVGLDWAKGTVPTPLGLIHVELKRGVDGTPEVSIGAPAGVEIVRG